MAADALAIGEHVSVSDTEETIIQTAQQAVSYSNWIVGECAASWTERYARGRTDADFALLVGLSPDQVFQRRRVWETFGKARVEFPSLKWSHFYVALTWEDAPECLQWAEENHATVQEMKAWRRALRGEDLAEELDRSEWGAPGVVQIDETPVEVRMPGGLFDPELASAGEVGSVSDAESNVVEYAPYRKDALTPAKAPGEEGPKSRPPVPPEERLKKIIGSLDRASRQLTDEVIAAMESLSEEELDRLRDALAELTARFEPAIAEFG